MNPLLQAIPLHEFYGLEASGTANVWQHMALAASVAAALAKAGAVAE